ncbi:hypothetical protein SMICM17S_12535 [Streptomyces microflavus]
MNGSTRAHAPTRSPRPSPATRRGAWAATASSTPTRRWSPSAPSRRRTRPGVRFHNMVTVSLGGTGTINRVINNSGGTVQLQRRRGRSGGVPLGSTPSLGRRPTPVLDRFDAAAQQRRHIHRLVRRRSPRGHRPVEAGEVHGPLLARPPNGDPHRVRLALGGACRRQALVALRPGHRNDGLPVASVSRLRSVPRSAASALSVISSRKVSRIGLGHREQPGVVGLRLHVAAVEDRVEGGAADRDMGLPDALSGFSQTSPTRFTISTEPSSPSRRRPRSALRSSEVDAHGSPVPSWCRARQVRQDPRAGRRASGPRSARRGARRVVVSLRDRTTRHGESDGRRTRRRRVDPTGVAQRLLEKAPVRGVRTRVTGAFERTRGRAACARTERGGGGVFGWRGVGKVR